MGWLWCSGNTEACGAFITSSILVSHPNEDFKLKNHFCYSEFNLESRNGFLILSFYLW